MTIRALIVDDEEEIVRTAGEVVKSLEHEFDSAGDIETARRHLETTRYDYLILDMNLPLDPKRLTGRRENGLNFITTIRGMDGLATLPIIVITGHDRGESDFILSVVRAGGIDFTQYVQKPIDGDKLDKAIREMLAKKGDAPNGAPPAKVKLKPFNAEKREIRIYEDRVTVCGIEVWRDCGQPDMHEILIRLNKKEGGGYVRVSGSKLLKELGRCASNPVGRPIKNFRDESAKRLKEQRHLECGQYDIIGKTGGYHFTDWMVVVVDGEEPKAEPTRASHAPAGGVKKPAADVASEDRQRRILEWIDNGDRLTQKEVIERFRRERKAPTIKRDLQKLRAKGEIATHAEGHYVRQKKRNRKDG